MDQQIPYLGREELALRTHLRPPGDSHVMSWGVDGFSSAREQLLQGDYRRWIGVWAPEELQLGVECGGGLVRLRGKAQATPAAGKLDLKLQQA